LPHFSLTSLVLGHRKLFLWWAFGIPGKVEELKNEGFYCVGSSSRVRVK
jgi:hypothetical protein